MPRGSRPRRRPTGSMSRPRYFLTVQVAQALDESGEDDTGGTSSSSAAAAAVRAGGGPEAVVGFGVGPVAFEFTLEGIDLLDTVATLRHAIEDKFFIPLEHQLLCGPLPSSQPLGDDDDTTLVSLGIVPGEAPPHTQSHNHTHSRRRHRHPLLFLFLFN